VPAGATAPGQLYRANGADLVLNREDQDAEEKLDLVVCGSRGFRVQSAEIGVPSDERRQGAV
jgi:hypothetical protein